MSSRIADIESIYGAAVEAVNPQRLIRSGFSFHNNVFTSSVAEHEFSIDTSQYNNIHIIGAGKAAALMAHTLETIFDGRVCGGIVAAKYGHSVPLRYVDIIQSGHPIPDANSLLAGEAIKQYAQQIPDDDLVLGVFSGGASACCVLPAQSNGTEIISLADKQAMTALLLSSGAAIEEINCVRKHISGIKGGRLAHMLYPARAVHLLLSDVIGDKLDVIASGMTVPDDTTYADAFAVLHRYDLLKNAPVSIVRHIENGKLGKIEETPKTGSTVFTANSSVIIGTNASAVQAAGISAERLGYSVIIIPTPVTGEAQTAAKRLYDFLKTYRVGGQKPVCVLWGGETTVTLTGSGKGGRNQEQAVSFIHEAVKCNDMLNDMTVLFAATDGSDGPTDAAGGVVSCETVGQILREGVDITMYLGEHDSYNLLKRYEALFMTGPTLTNVCDIGIALIS